MKVFLMDFSSEQLIDTAVNIKNNNIDISYWTGKKCFNENFFNKDFFKGTVFHDQLDAVRGIPPDSILLENFPPPSAEILQDLLECESTVLTMMTRMDYGEMPVIKKKHLYYEYVQYWDGILNDLKPDLIIFSDIPHASYNFVVYSLAKRYDIPTIMLETTYGLDSLMVVHDYKEVSRDLLRTYNEIKDESHDLSELSVDAREYFERLIDPEIDATPDYKKIMDARMNDPLRIMPTLSKVLENIRTRRFFATAISFLRLLFRTERRIMSIDKHDPTNYKHYYLLKRFKKIKDEYEKEYRALQSDADINKKFIYMPLQFQPECSTSPLGGVYVDQILAVKTLSAAIPKDWMIYVKEYPGQWHPYNPKTHLYRYKNYYNEIAELSNVRIIPPELSTFDLLDKCQAVCSVSGTAGWEAVARSKPVLFFGHRWYMYCEGVFRIDSVESCKAALDEILRGYKPDPQKVLNYFLALDKSQIRAAHVSVTEKLSSLSKEQSSKNLSDALLKEIARIKNNK